MRIKRYNHYKYVFGLQGVKFSRAWRKKQVTNMRVIETSIQRKVLI